MTRISVCIFRGARVPISYSKTFLISISRNDRDVYPHHLKTAVTSGIISRSLPCVSSKKSCLSWTNQLHLSSISSSSTSWHSSTPILGTSTRTPVVVVPTSSVHTSTRTPVVVVPTSSVHTSNFHTSTRTPVVVVPTSSVHTSNFHTSTRTPVVVVPTSSVHTSTMAKSKFEYVRQFESDDPCLPNCWLVVRIDGKAFHKFTDTHHYMKPNDERGLGLMTRAAQTVLSEFSEIVLAYGQSDEYSFIFHKGCKLYNRRASKIMTNVVSLFASSFTLFWNRFFNTQELQYPPSFDARVVLYPTDDNLKDYLSWRQADCHINNLYNTCFWKLVQEKGLSPARAQERLKGTLSSDKNELLFSDFEINYNTLPELYRKGTVLIRPRDVEFANDIEGPVSNARGSQRSKGKTQKATSVVLHCDIIGKQFWEEHPHILGAKRPT